MCPPCTGGRMSRQAHRGVRQTHPGRRGETLGVPTPTNRTLYRLVKGIEEVYGSQAGIPG